MTVIVPSGPSKYGRAMTRRQWLTPALVSVAGACTVLSTGLQGTNSPIRVLALILGVGAVVLSCIGLAVSIREVRRDRRP